VFALLSTGALAAQPADQFTKGQIEFKQGGKAFKVPLQNGRLEAAPVNFGKKSTEIRNLTLLYAGDDMDRVSLRIANVSGAKKYGKKNIGGFWVQTASGRAVFKSDKGDCAFMLKRVGKDRIEGAGACARLIDDGRGGLGLPVTDVKFSAMP